MMKRLKYKMANTLNCRAIFLQIWKQHKTEGEAFGRRGLKLHSTDGLLDIDGFAICMINIKHMVWEPINNLMIL